MRRKSGRVALRLLRRQLRRQKHREGLELVHTVLHDSDLEQAVSLQIEDDYDAYCDECNEMHLVGGPIQDFLQWVLDNQEAILAFIRAILFTADEAADAAA